MLAPYAIHKVQGVKVGFIGMTLEGTPQIVSQQGVAGLTFADEAATANRYARELRRKGVEAIVVLLHEGGTQAGAGGINDCVDFTGPVVELHISNPVRRESWRHESVITPVATGTITGFGIDGYRLALDAMATLVAAP